eukprot:5689279-Amphidinium_carterae.1
MVHSNLATPTTFILSNVNCAIVGLDTIMRNGLGLTTDGYRGYLGNDQTKVKLHHIGNHFYLKATVFGGFYNYVDCNKDFESWYFDWYDGNMVYGLHQQDIQQVPIYGHQSQQEASITRTLKHTYSSYTRRNRRTQPHSLAIPTLVVLEERQRQAQCYSADDM